MTDDRNEDQAAAERIRAFAGSWEDQAGEVDEESGLTVPDLLRAAEALEERAPLVRIERLTVEKLDAEKREASPHPS